MKQALKCFVLRAISLLLVLLATGCSVLQQPQALAPPQGVVPRLPTALRQPPLPTWCRPSCTAGLTAERESWLTRLTGPMPPASGASAPMTR